MSEAPTVPSTGLSWSVRIRLSVMMFLQFMMFAVWWQPLAAFLVGELGVTGFQKSLILSTMAIGCLVSPIIGMIADRHFASQKVLAVMNLLGAVLLCWAAQQTRPMMMFVALLLQQLCYMPTWGLTSSIAMTHSPAEKFPQIRVFGSIGWVASGLFGTVALAAFGVAIDGTAITLYCGAATSIVAAALALTLPNTPPPAKGQKASVVDVLGLRSVALMRDFRFAIFIVLSLLVMIPFSIYWSYCSEFLKDQGFRLISATMNWGQFVEMFVMVLVPVVLAKIGVKWAMSVGLAALVVRYLFFLFGGMYDQTWMYFGGILVHGVIYAFFFVGGQVYVDKRAPKETRAQAQGFIFLATFGLGLLLGNFINGELIERNSSTAADVAETFKLPPNAAFPAKMLTIPGAAASDVKLYRRALNDTEVDVLASSETRARNLTEEAKADNVSVDVQKGLVYSGDSAGLAGRAATAPMTFSMKVTLPVDNEDSEADDVLSGTLLALGDGALRVFVDDNVLVYRAGETEIRARTVGLPRKEEEHEMYVAGTFDGRQVRLFVNGAAHRMYNWEPIWMVTVISAAVLLALFVLLFRYKQDTALQQPVAAPAEAAAEAPAGDA
jgi:nucleoside transporter